MTKWKKAQLLSLAAARKLAREGKDILTGAGKELFSITTLGLYRSKRSNWGARRTRRRF